MLCTLYQIKVTMKIFSPAFFSAVGRACTKQHLTSYKHNRESKKVSTKSAGEFSRLIVFFCFAITERDTPSAITPSPPWRLEGWDGSVHTPAGCHSEQDPWSCLDSLTVWPHHLTKSKQPAGTFLQTSTLTAPPVSPWRSTMQNNQLPQPHINIHMKCGGVYTELWLVWT